MFLQTRCVVGNTEAVVVVLEVTEVAEEGSNELLLARSLSDTGLLEDVEAERLEEDEEESTVLELEVELISSDVDEDDDAVWLLEIELLSSDEDEDDVDETRVELELEVARDDDEGVDTGSKEVELVEEYEELEPDSVVLALALAGAEEVVDDEGDSLELEVSEELELDCATL